ETAGLPRDTEAIPVSQYRDWLRKRKEDEAKKAPAYLALDTYECLADQTAITKEDVAPIFAAARSRYFIAWDVGMTFLVRLAEEHLAARHIMGDIMSSGKAQEKVRVLALLCDRLPRTFCVGLIRQGLHDRGRFVREQAAERCDRLLLTEVLSELVVCAAGEKHPETRFAMEFHIGMMRDGYFMYDRPDGSRALAVRLDGTPGGWCWPGQVTPADIERKGIQTIIAEVREQQSFLTSRPLRWSVEGAL